VPVMDMEAADPIFIHGIMPRSGTNYLWDLLCTHPACAPARLPVREDLFLENSDHLAEFVEAVRSAWNPSWGDFSDELINRLYAGLGEGLTSFLWIDRDRRLLTKSPSVSNVDRFVRFFPGGRLVILIRDGRSVTQSCMSTFGWEFERGARTWASAAAEIRRFMVKYSDSMGTYLLVRYEDLLEDLEGSMRRILGYLGLDPELFDFGRAAGMPVRGSSVFFGPGRQSVHWDPVEKTSEFDPKQRWRSWGPDMLERFEWIAGEQLRYFGYPTQFTPIHARSSVVKHRARDWRWRGRTGIRLFTFRSRVRVGTATRGIRERLGLVRAKS
jgi:Sulfotransferase family